MKICAIICEFNPFHNGHAYVLKQARRLSGCDKVLCIMSGCFTQRGDIAVLDKFTRARHAILSGADCVIELPACFSVAPAEIFAKGAIKILNSIPEITHLAFGCENAEKAEYLKSAQLLLNETEEFKKYLNKNLEDGDSYIRSYFEAYKHVGGSPELLEQPNNILGLEYEKAILSANSNINILPIKRIGAGFTDGEIKNDFSSSNAIRKNLTSPLINKNVPDFVYVDLKSATDAEKFKWQARYDLISANPGQLKGIFGCNEGLENRLIDIAKDCQYDEILLKCTTKRYSISRIKRILCANLLGIYEKDVKEYLASNLYIKPLAVKKDCADEILASLSKSDYPVIMRGRDKEKLNSSGKKCFELDTKVFTLYNLLSGKSDSDNIHFI